MPGSVQCASSISSQEDGEGLIPCVFLRLGLERYTLWSSKAERELQETKRRQYNLSLKSPVRSQDHFSLTRSKDAPGSLTVRCSSLNQCTATDSQQRSESICHQGSQLQLNLQQHWTYKIHRPDNLSGRRSQVCGS